ncbi:MAG: enoyl-CoA hydratase/isomerase family protein [Euryarchaeota archaeon]|nr:enoyl-CoA hydratase/isomerase family protein [Euryarchaeota archaeon]
MATFFIQPRLAADQTPMTIQTVCVAGAGNMGTGIAQACAQGGLTVHLVDVDPDIPVRSKERMQKGLMGLVERGRYTEADVEEILARVHPKKRMEEAADGIDLAIEAVFESYDAKGPVFAAIDKAAPDHSILATNTSSLSVTRLAAATGRPDRFVGLHFFYPAMINKLVEVVKGDATSEETFAALMEVSRRIGKVPIETLDRPGFCVNRFFVPMMNEACRLFEEGVADIPTIDAAANRLFGTTMGPFELMNVTGPTITLHAQRTLHAELGPFYAPAKVLIEQIEGDKGHWSLEGEPDPSRFEAVERRLAATTIGIAGHLVEEGVANIEDTEKGATVGLRWARGPFALANRLGTARVLEWVRDLHEAHKETFPVPEHLEAVGKEGRPVPIRTVSYHREGHVAVITIERPAQLNALDMGVLEELDEALTRLETEEEARVAVITGEGKAFVAGADIKAMADKDAEGARVFTLLGQRVFRRIETLDKPVIAAVNGFAFGGGLELALACDFILAGERAELGLPEVSLGIIPGFGGTQRLPRRIGRGRARELVYTGRRLKADEAMQLGLVDRVYPQGSFMAETMKVAETVARQAPLAVRYAKRAMREGLDDGIEDGLRLEAELALSTFDTEDKSEGMKAFLERRAPAFTGR